MLTVLTQTPPFGEAPPPIAVATYAGARQKPCRAPLDDELGSGGPGAWRDQPIGRTTASRLARVSPKLYSKEPRGIVAGSAQAIDEPGTA
jgi:hypothetical protein